MTSTLSEKIKARLEFTERRDRGEKKHSKGSGKFGGKGRNSKFSKKPFRGGEGNEASKDRIAKRLAILGMASRREAEKLVQDGKVKINGIECKDLSFLVSYDDKIEVNGKPIANKPIKTQIYLFNKPAGYVTTNNDPQGRKTIFELIPSKFGRLIAVGRLDMNTEGLLLLTNNGELARVMEMPATGLKRIYFAKVVGKVDEKKLAELRNGIKIDGVEYGKMLVFPEEIQENRASLKIVIFEGKNNEIRRVMWHLGLKVIKLFRAQYGDFHVRGIPSGCIQESRIRVNLRDLERQASINAKKYNSKKALTAEIREQVKKELKEEMNKAEEKEELEIDNLEDFENNEEINEEIVNETNDVVENNNAENKEETGNDEKVEE